MTKQATMMFQNAPLFRNVVISLHKTPRICHLPQAPTLTSYIDKQWHFLKATWNQASLIWFFLYFSLIFPISASNIWCSIFFDEINWEMNRLIQEFFFFDLPKEKIIRLIRNKLFSFSFHLLFLSIKTSTQ